ncbi:protein Mpv17 [Rhincodon typus]|uniref:protein Mpv17 n=1 Tax=Rhincodon typus TaxID=259920 RepID=UPI00202F967D|nr:protein Mpv17 [Rhincodon typus]
MELKRFELQLKAEKKENHTGTEGSGTDIPRRRHRAESKLGRMTLPWRVYQMMMLKHPWKVQILTAGTLVGCSDVISQQLIERQGWANHDTKRTLRMTTVGLIYVVTADSKMSVIWNRTNDIWPTVQMLNFYFVPLVYRVLLIQVVALIWNTYLSWKANRI